MALTITNAGTGTNIVSASSATILLVTADVGDVVNVYISAANSGTNGASCISSVTDSAGNTYTQRTLINRDPGAANAGTTLGVYEGAITTALTLGTITVNYSPNCALSAIAAQRLQPQSGYMVEFLAAGAGVSGSAGSFTTTSDTIANGNTIFGVSSIETDDTYTPDSDTTNGSWSTAYTSLCDTGGDTSSQFIAVQYKTVTAEGTQTYNTSTSGGGREYAINWLEYRESSPLAVSLSGYWKLDESSGTATDSHSINHLTQTGTVGTATGKISGARDFSASNYLSKASNASLSTGDVSFTLACWVKLDALGALRPFMCKWADSGQNEFELAYSTGLAQFFFAVSSGGSDENYIAASTFGTPSTGTWYYVVGWHDADADTLNIQINNGTVDSTSYTSGIHLSTSAFQIGAKDTGGGFPKAMDGLIDEALFAKRVYTSDERTSLYNGGSGLAYPLVPSGGSSRVLRRINGSLIGSHNRGLVQ